MQIYIASDHAGFKLKNELYDFLNSSGYVLKDIGSKEYDPADDYPDYASNLAKMVRIDPESMGILLCRNGVGVCIVANKFDGIRAVNTTDLNIAISSRNDDDTNILCLGADYIDFEEAKVIRESLGLNVGVGNGPMNGAARGLSRGHGMGNSNK